MTQNSNATTTPLLYRPAAPQDDTVIRLALELDNAAEFVRRLCRTRLHPDTRKAVVNALNRAAVTLAYTVNALTDDEVTEIIETREAGG